MVPLQSDFDHGTQSHVLTCFMFPQQPPADEGRIWAILDFWCWTRPEPSIPATGQKDRGPLNRCACEAQVPPFYVSGKQAVI